MTCPSFHKNVSMSKSGKYPRYLLKRFFSQRHLYYLSSNCVSWSIPAAVSQSIKTGLNGWRFLRSPNLICPEPSIKIIAKEKDIPKTNPKNSSNSKNSKISKIFIYNSHSYSWKLDAFKDFLASSSIHVVGFLAPKYFFFPIANSITRKLENLMSIIFTPYYFMSCTALV